MSRTITKRLDMTPRSIPPIIRVNQYDSDFSIVFALFSSDGIFTIQSGTTARIRGTKKSGTGYSADATVNTTLRTVTVAGAQQMTAVAGENIYEITLYNGNKQLNSANFILYCEPAALDADTITDASVLRELNAIIEGAETATQAAADAEDAADRAEAAAESLEIDSTLTQEGHAADAKAVGDRLLNANPKLNRLNAIQKAVGIGYPADDSDSNIYFVDNDGRVGIILRDGFDSANSGGIKGYYHPDYPYGALVDENGHVLGELIESKPLAGVKLSILGDSISSFNGHIPSGYAYYYPREDVATVDDTWWKKLIDMSGMTLVSNASYSASQVCGDTTLASGWTACSDARINALKSENVRPDIIICYVGINDWAVSNPFGTFTSTDEVDLESTTITNFSDAYALMLYKIRNTYPDAQLFCVNIFEGRPLADDFTYPILNANNNSLHEMNHIISEIAHIFGAAVIDLQTCGIHYWNVKQYTINRTETDTGIHPNSAGMTIIANTVYKKLIEYLNKGV